MTIHYFSANITFNIFSLSKGNNLSGLTKRKNKKNCSIFIIHDHVRDFEPIGRNFISTCFIEMK